MSQNKFEMKKNIFQKEQALQSNFTDGYFEKKKKTGPEGPRRSAHHTQHATANAARPI
jgi:hypothetical protein